MNIGYYKHARNFRRNKELREERKRKNRLKRVRPDAQITLETRDILNKNNTLISYREREGYTKKVPVTLGYDALQYMAIVRRFIQKRYDLHLIDLELLLFLFPIGLWSKKDYSRFPHSYATRRISHLIDKGMVENIFEDRIVDRDDCVYRLTAKAKRAVTQFYKYLNKEETLPETSSSNPFFNARATRREMKVAELIADLNKSISGRTEDTKHHIKLKKRIKNYHKQKVKQRAYEKVNALQIRIQKQREERERMKKEKAEKLKDMQRTLSSYIPE